MPASALVVGSRITMQKTRAGRSGPLLIAIVMILASRVFGGAAGRFTGWAALLVTVLSIPVTVPWLVGQLGGHIAKKRSAAVWLAGRRLEFAPQTVAAPAVATGLLMFVAAAASGIFAQMSAIEHLTESRQRAVMVSWRDAKDSDESTLRHWLPSAKIAPLQERSDRRFAIFDDCDSLGSFLNIAITSDCESRVKAFDATYHIYPLIGGMQGSASYSAVNAALIAGDGISEDAVQQALNQHLPAVNIASTQTLEPPNSRYWISAAASVSVVLLTLGLLLSIGNRMLSSVENDRRLLAIGLRHEDVRRMQLLTLGIPVLFSILMGAVLGLVFIWGTSSSNVSRPATQAVIVELAIVAALSSIACWTISRFLRSWMSLNGRRSAS
jgi:uncharacterized membrane protein YqjE